MFVIDGLQRSDTKVVRAAEEYSQWIASSAPDEPSTNIFLQWRWSAMSDDMTDYARSYAKYHETMDEWRRSMSLSNAVTVLYLSHLSAMVNACAIITITTTTIYNNSTPSHYEPWKAPPLCLFAPFQHLSSRRSPFYKSHKYHIPL